MYLWIWPATGRGVSLSGTSSPIANIVTSQLPTFEWPPPSYWLPGLACESSGWGGSWEEHDPLKWTNHAEDNQTLWGTNESWRKVSASDNRMQTTSSTLLNIFEQFFFFWRARLAIQYVFVVIPQRSQRSQSFRSRRFCFSKRGRVGAKTRRRFCQEELLAIP